MNRNLPTLLPLVILVLMTSILALLGRQWWCGLGDFAIWNFEAKHSSQHIIDWYTFSHIIHGFLFFGALHACRSKVPTHLHLSLALLFEACWEVVENSPFIIDRYRTVTIALDYYGDAIFNSIADVGFCTLGFLFAARFPWKVTVSIAIAFELFTLYFIRDNLTLNVIMLLWPIDAIREWQSLLS
jgi:hypothetical protein